MSANELSRETYDRLAAELQDLSTRARIEISHKIEEARLLGDLSENGDYDAAKEEQGKIESRVRHLKSILDDAVVVESADPEVVSTGNIIEIRYLGDTATERYLYGSIEERNADGLDVISPGSPLGRALNGARPGEVVGYEAPGGQLEVEIVSITI